ncbi:MAG: DNA polymerase III subunit delta [Pyrinomonadaceae bacterium]
MPVIKRHDLRNQLKRREIARVYTLFGPETYLRDLAARTIADLSFGEGDLRDFNETEFSLTVDGNLRAALAAAEQLPMMASRRVVRLADVRIAASANRDTLKEDDEAILSQYLADPSPTAVVVFVADELNGVRKMGKLLRERSVAVEFDRLTDEDLMAWARDEVKKRGAHADEAALRHLIALVGPDVRRLTIEIGKLSTAALPDGVITFELVDRLVLNTREIDNFQLSELLLRGDRERALRTLAKQLDDGAEPVMLVGMLAYHFRRLLMAKEMMDHGQDRAEVAKVLKMRYSDQEPFLAAARRTDARRLKRAVRLLADADIALKTSLGGGPSGPRMQIEMLVCRLLVT